MEPVNVIRSFYKATGLHRGLDSGQGQLLSDRLLVEFMLEGTSPTKNSATKDERLIGSYHDLHPLTFTEK